MVREIKITIQWYISHADQVFDKVEKNHSVSHKNMTNKDSSTNRHIYLQIKVINLYNLCHHLTNYLFIT